MREAIEAIAMGVSNEKQVENFIELLEEGADPSKELKFVTKYSLVGGSTSENYRKVFFAIMEHGQNIDKKELNKALLEVCESVLLDFIYPILSEDRLKMIQSLSEKGAKLSKEDLIHIFDYSITINPMTTNSILYEARENKTELLGYLMKSSKEKELSEILSTIYTLKTKHFDKNVLEELINNLEKEKNLEMKNLRIQYNEQKPYNTNDAYDAMIRIEKEIENRQKILNEAKNFKSAIIDNRNIGIVNLINKGRNSSKKSDGKDMS